MRCRSQSRFSRARTSLQSSLQSWLQPWSSSPSSWLRPWRGGLRTCLRGGLFSSIFIVVFLSGGLAPPPSPALSAPAAADKAPKVEVVRREAERRVDVLVDGKPFTSYAWPTNLAKPVLFPIRTDTGQVITRGFPVDPQPDESRDHPHHVGLWFNYGDVAGIDFWGNSAGIRNEAPGPRHGSIVHRSIDSARGGAGRGELAVSADWLLPGGKPALREQTRFAFVAGAGRLAIDRVATLTATGDTVPLPDNKEGMLALRLAGSLEHPGRKNPKATGTYRSSEGKIGDDVWGTRARWVMLTGKVADAPVTVAILDHPKNPGFPTYWHARGYGLFAANPLGQKALSKGKETLDFAVQRGRPARFAYRVVLLSREASADDIEAEYKRFTGELK
jgi:hypothetical protein